MKNKEIIITLISMVLGIVILSFVVYAFFGFLSWILNDPFDWINRPKHTELIYKEPVDFQLCRDKGGIPIKSAWDGRLKRCDYN